MVQELVVRLDRVGQRAFLIAGVGGASKLSGFCRFNAQTAIPTTTTSAAAAAARPNQRTFNSGPPAAGSQLPDEGLEEVPLRRPQRRKRNRRLGGISQARIAHQGVQRAGGGQGRKLRRQGRKARSQGRKLLVQQRRAAAVGRRRLADRRLGRRALGGRSRRRLGRRFALGSEQALGDGRGQHLLVDQQFRHPLGGIGAFDWATCLRSVARTLRGTRSFFSRRSRNASAVGPPGWEFCRSLTSSPAPSGTAGRRRIRIRRRRRGCRSGSCERCRSGRRHRSFPAPPACPRPPPAGFSR